jgi:SAM-dependent methyltransferase
MATPDDGLSTAFEYTAGYCRELNPLAVAPAFVSARLAPPRIETACELGCGHGVSINAHAAASTIEYHGNDANPSHIVHAGELARAAGAACHLYDEPFDSFCRRSDLPDFDFIGLHGIWTWVAPENRRTIVDFVKRKLRPGGVLYVSYNAAPGWADIAPLRHVLAQHLERRTRPGDSTTRRVEASLEFARKLVALPSRFANAHPNTLKKFETARKNPLNYLVHEYFVSPWSSAHFSDVAYELHSAHLTYACSANLLDHAHFLNLTDEQQALLAEVEDPVFRETLRDYLTNQQFRRDYWVRGPRQLSDGARARFVEDTRVVLAKPLTAITPDTAGWLGAFTIDTTIFEPLIEILADGRSHSIGQILRSLVTRPFARSDVLQAVFLALGAGILAPANDDEKVAEVRPRCERLNEHLLQRAAVRDGIDHLVSPVTGGAVTVTWLTQLFLRAVRSTPGADDEALVRHVAQSLRALGLRLLVEGRPAANEDENIAVVRRNLRTFREVDEPFLRTIGVA